MLLTLKTYQDAVAAAAGPTMIAMLPERLMPVWCESYYDTNPRAELVTVDLSESGSTFTYLFDLALSRIVVACGVPIAVGQGRDSGRQRGYPKPQKGFVKGHLIAHSIGGGMDINFVPQLRGNNGGAFRRLENMAQKNALENIQSFYFVRALYNSTSDVPNKLEQCLVHPSGKIHYESHNNF